MCYFHIKALWQYQNTFQQDGRVVGIRKAEHKTRFKVDVIEPAKDLESDSPSCRIET